MEEEIWQSVIWPRFHKLWTWSVGLPGYNKNQWKEFEAILLQLKKDRECLKKLLKST